MCSNSGQSPDTVFCYCVPYVFSHLDQVHLFISYHCYRIKVTSAVEWCFPGILFFIYDPADVGNLISGCSAFSKSSLNIWTFSVHILLKPGLGNFEHHFASMCNKCNCAVVWAFCGIAFLWDWNENWPFLFTSTLIFVISFICFLFS